MKSFARILLLLIINLGVCCMFISSVAIAATDNGPTIILFSDDSESYVAPAIAFKQKIKGEVIEYELKGSIDAAPAIMKRIMKHKPSLIFALGAKAAWFAKAATNNNLETKVLFAMVLNWQRYNLLDGQTNVTGISTEISPGTQLFNLGLLSSDIKKIGVIYSAAHSEKTIQVAQEAAALLGFELIATSIQQASEFNRAWRQMSNQIDAYWVLTDPVLYTMNNIHWLNERCLKEKVLCVGQSDNITKLGILLSINTDNESVGNQAAAIAKRITHDSVLGRSIHPPIGTRITINASTAKKIGISLNENILSMVNDVVGQ